MANSTLKPDPTPDLTETTPSTTTKNRFIPKFDVKETTTTYELHGSLPGIEQRALSIEFIDADTLSITGKIERYHGMNRNKNRHRWDATVSSVDKFGNEVQDGNDDGDGDGEEDVKYWVEEREYGEFTRLFTFPIKVDQEKVWAEMRNGVLSVVVPKARARKIQVFVN